ncbi:70 kDa peptidyl-prolyl isomerase-like [Fopius arisanus]|uniref:70 kDa peptidyl-prolyl isomerase-like n=1 Tax=Fopius arisanus TaxID=64838 RepID=A0A9R1U2J1_9HYME|nr:PREDICTED: 70 kDa peptidyl-prolyl isomerase-like [Fopius arisanus]
MASLVKTDYSTSDGTIKKHVITHGALEAKPMDGSVCHLHIEDIQILPPNSLDLSTLNSEILSSKPDIIITINETLSQFDNQLEVAIRWMGEKEVARISIRLPAPDESSNDSITIEFTATLTSHIPCKPIWTWSPKEKYNLAMKYKSMGVDLVRENRFKDAFHRFSKSTKLLISMEPMEPDVERPEELIMKIQELKTSLYNNMAMCQVKYNNQEHAIELCTKVLQRDEYNVKALYRRGCAYGALRDNEKAIEDLQRAAELEPDNTAVKEKLKIYREKFRLAKIQSDLMVKRMFKS